MGQRGPAAKDYSDRLEMYESGMSDDEIAFELGLSTITICGWRSKNRLKPINPIKPRQRVYYGKGVKDPEVPMQEALSPGECEKMQTFLSTLVKTYKSATTTKIEKPDIGNFMRVYREVAR